MFAVQENMFSNGRTKECVTLPEQETKSRGIEQFLIGGTDEGYERHFQNRKQSPEE